MAKRVVHTSGLHGTILMTRRAKESDPIEYYIKWGDKTESWCTSSQLVYIY